MVLLIGISRIIETRPLPICQGLRIVSNVRLPFSLRSPLAAAAPLALACLVAGPAPAAAAADAAADVAADVGAEIIVTGVREGSNPHADPAAPYKIDRSASDKFARPLADTAKSISIIPKEVIQDSGALSVRDLVRTQSGVTLGTGEGGNAFGDRIFIRGFDARNDVYIDGLRDPGVTSREIFAVEQIEIVKGPSSTFGGRGTTGGAVSLVSKAPHAGNDATLEVTGGTDATRRLVADVNRELAPNLQVRINGLFHDADVAGRYLVWSRRWGVAAAVAWQPSPSVDIIADYYHLQADGLPDWGVPFDARSQQPFAVKRSNFYGVLARDFSNSPTDIGTLRVEWRPASNWKITSKTRYGWNRSSYIATAPERPNISNPDPALWTAQANPQNRNAVSATWANATEARAEFSTGSIRHTLLTGFEASEETITNRPFAFASSETVGTIIVPAIPVTQPIFAPDPFQPYPQVRTLSGALAETRVVTKAVYALDSIDLTPTLNLSAGLRFDDYRVSNYARTAAGVVTQPTNHSDFLNWNAALTWKPVPKATLYISASTSSNPSGEQTDGSSPSYGGLGGANANLDPERNIAYEAGVKYQAGPGGHLLLTAAVFRTDKTNARVTDPVSGGQQVLAGKQRVDGFEIGASGNITERLAVFGGYTFLDARVLATSNPPVAAGAFPNIPRDSLAVLTTYRLFRGVTIGGQASYNSRRYGGPTIAGTANLPAYWRFDATAKASLSSRVELQLNLLNLTDKTYYDAIYRSATPFAYVAPGRSLLATLRVKI